MTVFYPLQAIRNVRGRPVVHVGTAIIRIFMQTENIIERAFQLAPGSTSVEEIRKVLRQEGYSNVEAHLGGASIKADLKKQFVRA